MIDSQKKSLILGSLAAAGCEILFGLSYVFTKQVASESGVFALLGWRFFVAIAVMSLFIAFRIVKVDFRNKSLKALVAVALWNPCIYFAMETVGIRYSSASESGVMLACIAIAAFFNWTKILFVCGIFNHQFAAFYKRRSISGNSGWKHAIHHINAARKALD